MKQGLPILKKGLLNSSQKSTEPSKALAREVGPIAQAQHGVTSPRVPINMQDTHAGVGSAVLVQG